MRMLAINNKSYFKDIQEVRKTLLSNYDSILYPQINNDGYGPLYFHITGEDLEHPMFQLNHKYEWREVEEVVTAGDVSRTLIRYFSGEEYELKLQTEKHEAKIFHAKILLPSIVSNIGIKQLNAYNDNPPLLLVKGRHIVGKCSNPFLQGKGSMANCMDIYNSEMIDFNYNYMDKHFIKIEVLKSIQTKIESLDFNLNKEYILSSPYLEKGIAFSVNERIYSIWKDEEYLYMQCGQIRFIPSIMSFRIEDLPQHLSLESIKSLILSKINTDSVTNSYLKLGLLENEEYPLVRSLHNTSLIAHDNFVEIDEIDNEGNFVCTKIQTQSIEDCIKTLIYCISINTPEMRSYVKGGNSSKIDFNYKNASKHIVRKWTWGTDKVRYVYPKKKHTNKKITHYTRPHLCKFYVKEISKYREYNPIEDNGKYSIIKWRQGCWKGESHSYIMGKQVGGYSRKAIAWLHYIAKEKNIEIQHAENGGELRVELGNGKYYLLDGYCKENNTAYEFHGDVFHGNPNIYKSEDKCHPYNDSTAGQLLEYTLQKEDNLRKMGFNVVTVWEAEWNKMVNA